ADVQDPGREGAVVSEVALSLDDQCLAGPGCVRGKAAGILDGVEHGRRTHETRRSGGCWRRFARSVLTRQFAALLDDILSCGRHTARLVAGATSSASGP